MLRRDADIEIPDTTPFENDKLDRKQVADNLTRLVGTLKGPFVLSINSPWGTGKTTFVQMWKQHLTNEGYRCLYFNAWESDFSKDPLIAFIAEFEKLVASNRNDNQLQSTFDKVKKNAGVLSAKLLPLLLRVITRTAISNDEIEGLFDFDPKIAEDVPEFLAKLAEAELETYKKQKESLEGFRKRLADFIQELSQSNNTETETDTKPVIFFVDELDRCRPTFAIELLETIKHLFSVEGLVFILALDMEQLARSAKVLYGHEMDTTGYFRRLINLEFTLPKLTGRKLIQHLSDQFKPHEFDSRNLPEDFLSTYEKGIEILRDIFELSARDLYTLYNRFNLAFRILPPSIREFYPYILFLICLKIKKPYLYNDFISNKVGTGDLIIKLLPPDLRLDTFNHQSDCNFFFYKIGFYLQTSHYSNDEKQRQIAELENKYRKEWNYTSPSPIERKKYAINKDILYQSSLNIVEAIEFTGNFSESF